MAKHKSASTTITTTAPTSSDDRVLTTKDVLERIPIDRSTLWKMCRDGRFPRPIQLTRSRIGWRWSVVLAWLEERERHPVASRAYFRRATSGDADATMAAR